MLTKRSIAVTLAAVLIFAGTSFSVCRADGGVSEKRGSLDPAAKLSPITFFQKIISKADGDRCPMYPSCSHYAQEAFDQHGAVLGWVLTLDRLLRCGRDETRSDTPMKIHGVRYTYDPLKANTFWWNNTR
jgi:putative component of membrane protein insertase Oxa1/YidC/SpoIIIJ protein YidD